jgi:hypothetical protein
MHITFENLEEKYLFGDVIVEKRIFLECILRKLGMKIRFEFSFVA